MKKLLFVIGLTAVLYGAFHPFAQAQGQRFYCQNLVPFAEMIEKDLTRGLGHIDAMSKRDQRTVQDVKWCVAAKQPVRECVPRRCMEEAL